MEVVKSLFYNAVLGASFALFLSGSVYADNIAPIDIITLPAKPAEVSTYISLEKAEAELAKTKDKSLKPLKEAYLAFEKKNYGKALTALRTLKEHPAFMDFVHFLAGQAEQGLMKIHFSKKRIEAARAAGERARARYIKSLEAEPYSTLQKRVTILLGETEIMLGEINARAKALKKSRELLESGFQRLTTAGVLILVPQDSIVSYAILCDKAPDEICNAWVDKLADYLDKGDGIKSVQRVLALRPTITVEKKQKVARPVPGDWQKFTDAFAKFLEGDYNAAYEEWYELLQDYPSTDIKLRTKFWMARAAQKTNHPVQAETLFKEVIKDSPFTYYALLSSWFGKIDLSRNISAEFPLVTRTPNKTTPAELIQLRRAETLIASGMPALARLELKDIKLNEALPSEYLVYLAYLNHQSRAHLAVARIYSVLSDRGHNGLFSLFGEQVMFPKTYFATVQSEAKSQNVDETVPISIIKQESAFESDAVSSANAYGLMQIIIPTARDLDPTITVPGLLEPERNIKLGVKYIGQMLKRFDGSLAWAAAAYNAGPHNAARWLKTVPPGLPPEEYIELITYRETRGYVQNVLRNRYWYTKLIKKKTIENLEALVKVP